MGRILTLVVVLLTALTRLSATPPPIHEIIPLDDLKPGQKGEVWTVFRGTESEPFTVEVTGVVRNALGPGKSLILCELTDPRVQKMGAVAGMSGSPLYINGKFAGALSYQIQRFETVHYAGFTPAADLAEVQSKGIAAAMRGNSTTTPVATNSGTDSLRPLKPMFTLSGLSPVVADLFAPRLAALGLSSTALGGSIGSSGGSAKAATSPGSGKSAATATSQPLPLHPGDAISVALATGDITLAGTGTVSSVDGTHVTAFGHPMMSLGEVALPMCSAEIVTILPSLNQSMKVANTGNVIGTITQDRLSAISGSLGAGPEMTEVEVDIASPGSPAKTLHFSVARHEQLTPVLVATGVSQAILGSNDAGLTNGFLLSSDVTFPTKQTLATRALYAGPQGFQQGLNEFVADLTRSLQNPYEKTFPRHVTFTIQALEQNPAVTLDLFQLSRNRANGGETVQATLAWRDYQGEARRQTVDIPIDPSWAGKSLQVVLAPGRVLDEMSGRPKALEAAQVRSFDAYLASLRDSRPADGLCIAVVEKTKLFTDQTNTTPDAPNSIERIARAADEARFQQMDAVIPLWESHVLDGKLSSVVLRRPLQVFD